jgi:hypothetical protein
VIGALSDQLPLPLELDKAEPVAACPERAQRVERVTGPAPCCAAPYCSGCTITNSLSAEDTRIMRAHLARLISRPCRRP